MAQMFGRARVQVPRTCVVPGRDPAVQHIKQVALIGARVAYRGSMTESRGGWTARPRIANEVAPLAAGMLLASRC
jgi:hypothetical protein